MNCLSVFGFACARQCPGRAQPTQIPATGSSAVTVEAISEATIQVLLTDGPIRLTTTRVAQRAGVSVGTLYQYFPHKRALFYAVLDRHLAMIAGTLEAACLDYRGATIAEMTEAVVGAYLRAKTDQSEVSGALYVIAIELDAGGLIEAATRRGEEAIAAMLSTAGDGRFGNPHVNAQTLLAAVSGTARALFERNLQPALAGEIGRELRILSRSYLVAASSTLPPPA